jgi:hypothetical protein
MSPMRRMVTASLRSLLAALVLFVVAASAQAQPPGFPFNPTHYWTYQMAHPAALPTTIFVQDQFFRGGVQVTLGQRQRLLDWVSKNNSPVLDTLIRYTWWNIPDKLPVNRSVIVTNQFGSFPVTVLNLEFLLTPAFKYGNPAGPPVGPLANHYLCYRATGFPGPAASYGLRDEWRVDLQHPGPMEFLCAPCAKQHQGQTFAVLDTVTHLAAYRIAPTSGVFASVITDQFVSLADLLFQGPIEYLFVPGEKTDLPVDAKRSTWGRVKQLYR